MKIYSNIKKGVKLGNRNNFAGLDNLIAYAQNKAIANSSAAKSNSYPASYVTTNGGNAILPNPSYKDSAVNKQVISSWASGAASSDPMLATMNAEPYYCALYGNAFGFDLSNMGNPGTKTSPPGSGSQAGAFSPMKFETWINANYPDIAHSLFSDISTAQQRGVNSELNAIDAERSRVNNIVLGVIAAALTAGGAIVAAGAVGTAAAAASKLSTGTGNALAQGSSTSPQPSTMQAGISPVAIVLLIGIIISAIVFSIKSK